MEKEVKTAGYSVKKLADLTGVSVRTLHLYDKIGLLKPQVRTEAGYRLYGEKELLLMQQILFYKELGFPLQEIIAILHDPDFDLVQALESHREVLLGRRDRLATLLITIDKTIKKIIMGMTFTHEELYEGFPKGKAEEWRKEAIDKYGSQKIEKSERYLGKLGKQDFIRLKEEGKRVTSKLLKLMAENPASEKVQEQIADHYEVIRKFWGTHGEADPQAEAYAGLGELYVTDERYTMENGIANPEFAEFLRKAMKQFAENLKR